MASFNDTITQARSSGQTRNVRQRTFLLAGAGATALLLAIFVRLHRASPITNQCPQGLSPDEVQSLNASSMPMAFPIRPAPTEKQSAFRQTSSMRRA